MLLPRRRGLKRRWRTELKSSVWEPHWHPRMLGNAIQALQRSIVRITIVRGKGNFAVQSQIVSRLLSLLPLSPLGASYYENWEQTLTLFSRIILWPLKWRISGHPAKSETRPSCLTSPLLPICSHEKSDVIWDFSACEQDKWSLIRSSSTPGLYWHWGFGQRLAHAAVELRLHPNTAASLERRSRWCLKGAVWTSLVFHLQQMFYF